MPREITGTSTQTTERFPMVGIRKISNYVKGKVIAVGATTNNNPFVTLTLIDLDGSTSVSTSKGVYTEVEVNEGDTVQLIGTTTDLKEKLPQLAVGDVVTITHSGDVPSGKGHPKQLYKVVVE